MDGHAHAGDARGVRHREVVARLHRHLAPHLDLAAEVHQEGPVGDVHDLHGANAADLVDDLLAVRLVSRLEGEVAGNRRLGDLDQVDRADIATGLADGRGDLPEHPGLVGDLQPDGEAVARTGQLHVDPPLIVIGARPGRRNPARNTAAAGTPPLERVYLTSLVDDFARRCAPQAVAGLGPRQPRRAYKSNRARRRLSRGWGPVSRGAPANRTVRAGARRPRRARKV